MTDDLTTAVKNRAREIGFDLIGIAPAVSATGFSSLQDWLRNGYAGEMAYMPNREAAYEHPSHVLETVRSVVMLAVNYNNGVSMPSSKPDSRPSPRPVRDVEKPHRYGEKVADRPGEGKVTAPSSRPSPPQQYTQKNYTDGGGERELTANGRHEPADSSLPNITARVAKYARGSADYHDILRDKLKRLADFLHDQKPGCRTRGVVDTAPLLERDFAKLAGLGWFGKNTMLINKRAGSWLFLAALLTDIELKPDAPHETSHCGTCTRCLDVCPTEAFPEPYVLDARKCISYLTIELRSPIPEPLRPGIGDWLFGCDLCQDVCPWNNKAGKTTESAFQPVDDLSPADAIAILQMNEIAFRERFRHTPLSRPKRAGLLRNAAIVLGNSRRRDAVPALLAALSEEEPLIRGASAWALGQLGGEEAIAGLESRQGIENDHAVQTEIAAALSRLTSGLL